MKLFFQSIRNYQNDGDAITMPQINEFLGTQKIYDNAIVWLNVTKTFQNSNFIQLQGVT
jgi:hypothetical protein